MNVFGEVGKFNKAAADMFIAWSQRTQNSAEEHSQVKIPYPVPLYWNALSRPIMLVG